MMAETLVNLGVEKAMIVHSNDGLDEISIFDKTNITEINGDKINNYTLNPKDYFDSDYRMSEIIVNNTKESLADEEYKKMIINSNANDIVYTAAVSGVNANFLRSSLESMGITEELWSKTKKIDFGSELDAAKAEAQAWKTIWSAGQGVTSIDDVKPTAELVDQLKNQFKSALENQHENYKKYHATSVSGVAQNLNGFPY